MAEAELTQKGRLWPIGVLATMLPLLSWFNTGLVARINSVLHQAEGSEIGWTWYTAGRAVLFAFLIVLVYRLAPPSAQPGRTFTSPAKPERSGLFDPLMGLRALAAVMVLLGHYFLVGFFYKKPAHGVYSYIYFFLRSCPWAGVWIFFTLSGFLMGKGFASGRYSFRAASVWAFYRNRFLRIMPLYVGALLVLSLLLTPAIFKPAHLWQLTEMLIFDYRGDLAFNPVGSLWSVSTEVQFYFLVPFLFLAFKAIKHHLPSCMPFLPVFFLGLGTTFRWWVAQHFGMDYWTYGYEPLLPNLDLFLVGMSLAFLAPPSRWPGAPLLQKRWALPVLAAALYTSTAIVTTFFYKGEKPATLLHFLELVPGATCLLASLYIVCGQAAGKVLLRPGAVGLLQNLVLRCGTLTYAIYVLHGPLLQVLRDALKPPFPSPLSLSSSFGWFPVALVAIWLSAELAYRFVEEPVERRKHVPGTALTDAP